MGELEKDKIMVNVLDADSLIPEQYVCEIDRRVGKSWVDRHRFIFQLPQIFSVNAKQVPLLVSYVDTLMAFSHEGGLYSPFSHYSIAMSNYSLSYCLLERIGFWDVCEMSKGEDQRISAKAYFETNGDVFVKPIFVPANQLSLRTGKGIIADCFVRFGLAKRLFKDQV